MERRQDRFADSIGVNVALLKLSGVIPRGGEIPGDFSTGGTNVLAGMAFLSFSVYTISYVYEFARNIDHLDSALAFFTMIISIAGGQARFGILLFFRKKLGQMLLVCEGLWSNLDTLERKRIGMYTKKVKRLTYYYMSGCAFTILFYGVAGLLANFGGKSNDDQVANATDGTPSRNLPYAFVIEIRESPYYEIAYVLQLWAMTSVGLTCVGTDTVGPLLALVISGHFDVIQSRLTRFTNDLREDDRPEEPTREQRISLGACLRYHQIALEYCRDIECLTNVMSLTQLMGSTYNISLVGFKLAGSDPDKFKYTTQLSIAVIQLFLCNWPPDVLLSASEAIGRTAYSLPWYRYPSWLRRPTSIMLIRSQRSTRLTAGKFVTLSLEMFATMISSAASFFTVISNVNL